MKAVHGRGGKTQQDLVDPYPIDVARAQGPAGTDCFCDLVRGIVDVLHVEEAEAHHVLLVPGEPPGAIVVARDAAAGIVGYRQPSGQVKAAP